VLRKLVPTVVLAFLAAVPSADAAEATGKSCVLSDPETATVAEILDGETLKVGDGMIGAKAPAPPLGWRGDDPWPLVEESKQALDKLASGKQVELRFGGRRSDRYDHLLAEVFVMGEGGPIWLQEELVSEGLARVYSFPDNRACIAELLTRESEARAKRLGVWGSPAYRIQSADDLDRLGRLTQSYQLVEGTVARWGKAAGASISTSATIGGATSPSASSARTFLRSWRQVSTSRGLPATGCGCVAGSNGATGR
jgi:endonuclease YncB( thermonuclease family)